MTLENELVVFLHPHALAAGLQVPGGTVNQHEYPQEAVLREVYEETGIREGEAVAYLGRSFSHMGTYDRDELQEKHFFHLTTAHERNAWVHREMHDGMAPPKQFRFFWMRLRGPIELAAGQGALLSKVPAVGAWASLDCDALTIPGCAVNGSHDSDMDGTPVAAA